MIIIGGPIYARAWILPYWFECIEKQDWPLHELGFIFEGSPYDGPTKKALFDWQSKHPEVGCFEYYTTFNEGHKRHGPAGQRRWSIERYKFMASLRNAVLDHVRVRKPERFFSLDSDILLEDPSTIRKLYELTATPGIHGAAPLMYMTPKGTRFPSVMTWVHKPGGYAKRMANYPIGTTFRADVIMAAKMMSPELYNNVNYEAHRQGEDLGWSANAAKKGYNLFSMSGTYAPHIMNEKMLEDYLKHGDTR